MSTDRAPTAALALLDAEGVERIPTLLEDAVGEPRVRGAEEIVKPDAVDEAAVVAGDAVAGDEAEDTDGAADALEDEEAALDAAAEEALEEPLPLPVAEAPLPPTSVPMPQGMVEPCWVGVAAATVAPSGPAIVKRVVHVRSEVPGAENW